MPMLLSWSLVFSVPGLASAFPSLRERFPNGRRVPCPDGVSGCSEGVEVDCQPTLVCNGVGHATCSGGTFPLNPFGQAFVDQERQWTRALCEADSDGDGLTNGEELGDPCCLWAAGDKPSNYMRAFTPVHPGFKNTDAERLAYSRPQCEDTQPAKKGIVYNKFTAGEEQRSVELRIDNFTITPKRTTYDWFALNFPDESQGIFHAVYIEALVDQKKNLHHYIVRGCNVKFPDNLHGQRLETEVKGCNQEVGAWTPGSDILKLPTWIGKPIGKDAGMVAFAIQVHYDNPELKSGIVDSSGMRIWYTPTLRGESASGLATMMISVNSQMSVPAGVSRWFLTRTCTLEVTDAEGNKSAKMNVLGGSFHAHLLGREMYAEVLKVGSTEWRDLGSERTWHFDDQYDRDLALRDIALETGDIMQTTCVMDSRGLSSPVVIGKETTDEMCWAHLKGYPGGIRARCEGEVWMGELGAKESGLGIAFSHPSYNSTELWDGSNMLTGGTMLRTKGLAVSGGSCADQDAERCLGIVQQMMSKRQGEAGCELDLGIINPAYAGMVITQVCCQSACALICPSSAACNTNVVVEDKFEPSINVSATPSKLGAPWCLPEPFYTTPPQAPWDAGATTGMPTTVTTTTAPVFHAPRSLTLGGACTYKRGMNGLTYDLVGTSADGWPFYKAKGVDEYIYHDADCDGVGPNGVARWILDNDMPNTTATRDLDGDSKCDYHARLDSTSGEMLPTCATWRMYCGEAEGWISVELTLNETSDKALRASNMVVSSATRGGIAASVAAFSLAIIRALVS